MREETISSDITVIGGGLSGVCAAIAAARLGKKVSLVQNRPVLGGNSSSEVRVWVCGATAHGQNRYARETGIMGELFVENQYRNPDGNPYFWDLVVLEAVRKETNIHLFLNTDVHEVEAGEAGDDGRLIHSVTGWMMGSERRIRFVSKQYLDCTGDGLIGFLAGAQYRLGRESKHEYNEDWAPDIADNITLGSTLLFYTKDAGHAVKYIPPTFAKDIRQTSIPLKRVIRSGDNGCAYWWIEWGGELDTVHDNERIRDELWAVIYGIWDYIKNSGSFDAENMTLEWVGSIPGKREYRRFVGDYILNQNDIVKQTMFDDRVAFGGWSIDLHPPQGVYATESGSKHYHADGIYSIPFRSLYSINVSNMLMAGRNISATHVAFGSTRVMATCAVIGEAAGTAAALCAEYGMTPHELHERHLNELQQLLLRQDASVIGICSNDPADYARSAQVTASSTLRKIRFEQSNGSFALATDIGLSFPVEPKLNGLELLVDAEETTALTVELWSTSRMENYVPDQRLSKLIIPIDKGSLQWVNVPFKWVPEQARNAFVIIRSNERVSLHRSDTSQFGVLVYRNEKKSLLMEELESKNLEQLLLQWNMAPFHRASICFRLSEPTEAYTPDKIIDGYHRPYGGPHLWCSDPLATDEAQWVELKWPERILVQSIHLTFNDDVNEDLINLHHHRTEFSIIPELMKAYRIEAIMDGQWKRLVEVDHNRKRKAVHRLTEAIMTDRLRIHLLESNGSPTAQLIEARVYGWDSER